MTTNTKVYINHDMSVVYPVLKKLGFTINEICINGTFYDAWKHDESGLIIHAHFDRVKKKRRRFLWSGKWTNFSISVKSRGSGRDYQDLDVNHTLKREFVSCLGGRIEVRMQDNVTERFEYPQPDTRNTQRIQAVIQQLINESRTEKQGV